MKQRICAVFALSLLIISTSCSTMVEDFTNLKEEAIYTVNCHFEKLDKSTGSWETDSSRQKKLLGTIGKETSYVPEAVPGFTALEVQQQKVQHNGSTVVDVYYKRKTITVTFNLQNGSSSGMEEGGPGPYSSIKKSGLYGAVIEFPSNPVRANYHFEDWDLDSWSHYNKDHLCIYPEEDCTINARWSQTGTWYRVNHYIQRDDGEDTFTVLEWEEVNKKKPSEDEIPVYFVGQKIFSGIPTEQKLEEYKEEICSNADNRGREVDGEIFVSSKQYRFYRYQTPGGLWTSQTNARAYNLPGLENVKIEQKIIEKDNTTIVNILYDPKIVIFNFYKNGGTWNLAEGECYETQGAFDTFVEQPDVTGLSREGYEFIGWTDSENSQTAVKVPAKYPAINRSFFALWKKVDAHYTIKHYFEGLDSTDENRKYVLQKTETATGKIGSQTEAQAMRGAPTEGFDIQEIQQKTILENDSTIIEIYYNRKTSSLTFNPAEGTWHNGSSESITVTGKYGTPVPYPGDPEPIQQEHRNFTFAGWNKAGLKAPETFPAVNHNYDAVYIQDAAEYTVTYRYQTTLLGDNYESSAPESYWGKVGEQTNVTAPFVPGFEDPVFDNTTIQESGTQVLVTYNRKTITLSFDPNGGTWTSAEKTGAKEVKGKYGCPVTAPSTEEEDLNYVTETSSYKFIGWSPAVPETFPEDNLTLMAQWTQETARYSVATRVEQEDGNYLTESIIKYTGKLNSSTDIKAEPRPGYNAIVTNTTISANGNSTAYISYARKEIAYTYKVNGGYWTIDNSNRDIIEKGKYLDTVVLPASATNKSRIARKDYEFTGWKDSKDLEPPVKYGTENNTYFAQWTQVSADYTVNHYLETLTIGEFEALPYATETLNGLIDQKSNARAKSIAGYSVIASIPESEKAVSKYAGKELIQKTVNSDGSTVINIYYKRNEYTLTFEVNGGYWTDNSSKENRTATFRFGETVEVPGSVRRDDYVFNGWTPALTSCPASNTIYDAQWKYRGTAYTVKYLFQELDGSYTEKTEYKEVIKANVGDTTQATPLKESFEGFTPQQIIQKTVEPSTASEPENKGTEEEYWLSPTVVEVKYNRNRTALSFDAAGGKWNTDSMDLVRTEGQYGAAVVIPAEVTAKPSRQYYVFMGWLPAVIPETYPAASQTFTAQWKQVAAPYRINYLYESITGEYRNYSSESRLMEDGIPGQLTSVTAENKAGFKTPEIIQQIVNPDGSTVVEVKYPRADFTLYFDPNGGTWSNESTEYLQITGKYEETVSIPNITKPGFGFAGWIKEGTDTTTSAPGTFTENARYEAKWIQTTAEYTVVHKLQNADDDGYTTAATQNFGGTIGETTVAEAKSYTGFTAKPFEQKTIEAEGTTVTIEYQRLERTITLDAAGGTLAGPSTIIGRYGSLIVKPKDPVREDYAFNGWAPSIPDRFPITEGTYYAQWTKEKSTYVVKTYTEEPDGTLHLESTRNDSKGTVGKLTDVTVSAEEQAEKTGFVLEPIQQQIIKEDGSTIVEVIYRRKLVTYTFNGNGGTWSGANTVSGKYGSTVTIPDTSKLSKDGWIFMGWTETPAGTLTVSVPSTFGSEDKIFYAMWKSGITGVGKNPAAKDIVLTKTSVLGRTISFAVDVPYDGQWKYRWYIDGRLQEQAGQNFTKELTPGVHTIQVQATENDRLWFTKMISVTVR